MGTVHDLIENYGKQAALQAVLDRREVEAAASYLADEDAGIGFLYSGWCQAALPHKRLPDAETWQIRSEHVSMLVQPGVKSSSVGQAISVGVPYGSRARLIMFYVQSEALRTSSREVELGRSMNNWLYKMGVPLGGNSIRTIKDQAERISRCSFTFDGKGIKAGAIGRMTIFDKAIFADYQEMAGQGSLFPQVAKLSEQFFDQLTAHPVPLDEAAVRAINNNSMALDVYAWLSYRLHALKGITPISWTALKGQFGVGFDSIHHFRTTFKENLRLALAVYRDARLEVTERGVDLYPSRPPIAPRIVGSGRVPGSTRGKNTSSDSGRVLAQQPPRAQETEEIDLDHIGSIARRQR
jgi:hypothetical protein